MNSKNLSKKLVGSDDERAVSPVIGVILMVAITVILAAVIAAFVLDLGDSVGSEATAGVDINEDSDEETISVTLNTVGNAEEVVIRGDVDDSDIDGDYPLVVVGDTATLDDDDYDDSDGTIQIVGITEDGTETVIQSHDYDFN